MASVANAMIRNSAARIGARNAMPPSSESDSLPRARGDHPDDQEQRDDDQAVVDHLEERALGALLSRAKMPSTMKPSCAIEE